MAFNLSSLFYFFLLNHSIRKFKQYQVIKFFDNSTEISKLKKINLNASAETEPAGCIQSIGIKREIKIRVSKCQKEIAKMLNLSSGAGGTLPDK